MNDREFFDMLWKWFEDRGALTREQYRDGMTAEDFRIMLDEHEQALMRPKRQGD